MAANVNMSLTKAELVEKYVGKCLRDVEVDLPAAVLDLIALNRNCDRMSDAVPVLGDMRLNISSLKTTEILRIQIGEPSAGLVVKLLAETISDAESVLPFVLEYQEKGATVNLLYGSPITPNKVDRISDLNSTLKTAGASLSLLIDDMSHFNLLKEVVEKSGHPVYIYINMDSGDRTSGMSTQHNEFRRVFAELSRIVTTEKQGLADQAADTTLIFIGFHIKLLPNPYYYNALESLNHLAQQLLTLLQASKLQHLCLSISESSILPNLSRFLEDQHPQLIRDHIAEYLSLMTTLRQADHTIEICTTLHSNASLSTLPSYTLPRTIPPQQEEPILTTSDIPLTILTEVTSIYHERSQAMQPELLLDIGISSLGATPQNRFALLSQWNLEKPKKMDVRFGWHVFRVEEEQAVMGWVSGAPGGMQLVRAGQRVRVYPWDGGRALGGGRFGWFLVVDSSVPGKEDEIVDVWVRWG